MKSDTHTLKASASASKDGLKSMPLPELEQKLGASPAGLSQAEARKRLAQYGPNEIKEKQINPFLKFLSYFLGAYPLDDRSGGNPFRYRPALA